MLTTLNVQNLVVVREIEIDFERGLTVLTGETGAGKSILIEALGLALGERADSNLVRTGAERAVVTACFDIAECPAALGFLKQHELDHGDECLLRRVVGKDGRSRAFLNASPVTLATLRELAANLVDVHAQHANQRLLEREQQRRLLDEYGNLRDEAAAVREAWATWKRAADALDALERDGADRARLDLLRYQVEELLAARIDAEELASIESEYKKLANGGTHLEQCSGLRQALNDDEAGVLPTLQRANGLARTLLRNVPEAANLATALEQAVAAVDDALGELDGLETTLEADPERLAQLDRRLAELHDLARKHHIALGDLAALSERLAAELAAHEDRLHGGDQLRADLRSARDAYQRAADALSGARSRTAALMNADISARMRELGIPHARFVVQLTPADHDTPQSHGQDRIEFTVSTNPDQAPGALNKVASGGELSRIGLAIQAATAEHTGVPVVVYDEVDTGIGGTTANIVGRNLREVAAHGQVICITHSPQVASAGDHHVLVDKQVVDGRTETTLRHLDRKNRENEIARMLGATEATRSSLQHARDLLAAALQP